MTDDLIEQPARESQVATHTDPEVLCDYLNLFAGTTSAEQNRLGDLTAATVMRSAVLMIQAQDVEVKRLTAERDRLTEALRPFSRLSGLFAHWQDDTKMRLSVTVGDVRRARAALEESK